MRILIVFLPFGDRNSFITRMTEFAILEFDIMYSLTVDGRFGLRTNRTTNALAVDRGV